MSALFGANEARLAAAAIERRLGDVRPELAIVLGSGLGGLADQIERMATVPFGEIPGFPAATVAGHAGALIVGRLEGKVVVALAGRFHAYEGHDVRLAAFPARVGPRRSARPAVGSSPARCRVRRWRPRDRPRIGHRINLTSRKPLIGSVEARGRRLRHAADPSVADLPRLPRNASVEQGVLLP